MEYTKIKFSMADGIARLVLADPANRNALGLRGTQELHAAAIACEAASNLRCVLLTGEGAQFSVGGDLNEFIRERARLQAHAREMTVNFHAAILILNRLAAPLVCGVNGLAAGGGLSLVCMSDFALAKRSAKMNFAYTRSGLTPDGGATYFLPRLVGLQRAFDILATNPTLSADEAYAMGLIARVVDDSDYEAALEAVVQQLARMPSTAVGRLKMLLRSGVENSLAAQLDLEGRTIAALAATPETLATLEQFLAKRRP